MHYKKRKRMLPGRRGKTNYSNISSLKQQIEDYLKNKISLQVQNYLLQGFFQKNNFTSSCSSGRAYHSIQLASKFSHKMSLFAGQKLRDRPREWTCGCRAGRARRIGRLGLIFIHYMTKADAGSSHSVVSNSLAPRTVAP